jgi:enoyl-CoA hydratase
MSYACLDLAQEGDVAWLTLNRPESLNALNPQLVTELRDFFGGLPDRDDVRVVVLRGAGRAFCAGLDLKDHGGDGDRTPEGAMRGQRRISEIVMMMRRCPQPIIACVHGAAAGGGFALALASDVRLAGESARMNAAFIKLGLSACDIGVSYFLPRTVGASVAYELMMTGRFIHADRALATGLVSCVVPDDALEAEARQLAQEMIQTSPLGLRLTKECLNASLDAPNLESAVAMEDRNQVICATSPYMREGVRAFLEKRPPDWSKA